MSRGCAQRLPNGNTLVTEANDGHVFEVTTDGDVVWDYVNTDRDAAGDPESIYRALRYAPGAVESWL